MAWKPRGSVSSPSASTPRTEAVITDDEVPRAPQVGVAVDVSSRAPRGSTASAASSAATDDAGQVAAAVAATCSRRRGLEDRRRRPRSGARGRRRSAGRGAGEPDSATATAAHGDLGGQRREEVGDQAEAPAQPGRRR